MKRLFILAALASQLLAQPAVPQYQVKRVVGRIVIDGKPDDPTYLDDAVEIFINPKPSQTSIYFGLEMNARGVLYDYLMSDARYAFKRFNLQGVLLATYIRGTLNVRGDDDEGWS